MVSTSAPGLTRRRIGYRQIIEAPVRLDARAAMSIIETFWDAVESGAWDVWLDLSRVTSVHEPAVQLLDRLSVSAHELNRRAILVCPPGPTRDAVRRAGLHEIFEIHDTLSAAHLGG